MYCRSNLGNVPRGAVSLPRVTDAIAVCARRRPADSGPLEIPAPEDDQLESKKLDEFHDTAITALHFVEGELSSEALNSLLSAFTRCHVTVLTLSCLNCHLSCTVDEFVDFLECCQVKTLAVNAVNMRPFVHELLQLEVVHNLSCLLLYSVPYVNNAPLVLSSMFHGSSPSLKDFRILLKEWKDGFFDILRFHIRDRIDWPDRNKVISGLSWTRSRSWQLCPVEYSRKTLTFPC